MKRNIRNIRRLASFIERGRYEFNMLSGWARPTCGTAGCIGGHAAVLWPSLRKLTCVDYFSFNDDALAEKLGLSSEKTDDLCYGNMVLVRCGLTLGDVTRIAAVEMLRNLAKTGRVRFLKRLCTA